MRSVNEKVMADSEAPTRIHPIQQEFRNMVKDELGLKRVEDLTGKVYTPRQCMAKLWFKVWKWAMAIRHSE